MAFEEVKENVEDLRRQAKELLDANIRYYKLYIFRKINRAASKAFTALFLGIMVVFVLIFFSIALAIAIGNAINDLASGFLIVGGLYIVVTVIMYYTIGKYLEKRILEKLSRKFFKHDEQ
ncbi:hypothetical protein CHU92_00635 [Flavobacterium cyanobacteriorum]|uniref:Competence protein n=1 Tax=Flavobacterium cyanobacteriorum TaxID=2022802 RepID=A0A256A444_9FLAO|nr:phage holin family protein [Flavobacterium cyanobacteriorum]OYQ48627.1 hypothetical protein CHU92_00635 [Flavobacterium cyanobacteriorum]